MRTSFLRFNTLGWLMIVAALQLSGVVHCEPALADPPIQVHQAEKRLLLKSASEEKTMIANLASQQMKFREMGRSGNRIARAQGVWIRRHKSTLAMLTKLLPAYDAAPSDVKIIKPATFGTRQQMLDAIRKDYEAAISTSQMRYMMTENKSIRRALHLRAVRARRHLRQLQRM